MQLIFLSILLVIIGVIVLWKNRRKPWMFILWFPLFIASSLVTLFAVVTALENFGKPDFAPMVAMFVLLFSLPAIVLFVSLLIAHPRPEAQRGNVVVSTLIGTALLAAVVFNLARTNVTLQVTDASGRPLRSANFNYRHHALGGIAPLMRGSGRIAADKTGRVRVSVFHGESIDGKVSSEVGEQAV
jgi:hypothetical protein